MVDRIRQDRIGTALHALAADLVTERRRVLALERENKQLREELEALQSQVARPEDELEALAPPTTDCPDAALSI